MAWMLSCLFFVHSSRGLEFLRCFFHLGNEPFASAGDLNSFFVCMYTVCADVTICCTDELCRHVLEHDEYTYIPLVLRSVLEW